MRAIAIVVSAGALFLCLPPATEAQNDPRLAGALALARDGSADSARAVVGRLLAAIPPTDTLYAEALYTAGSIAGSAQDMQRYFQRIAIEYAWSPWADDALLRLAQIDFAANDQGGAVRNLEAIRQDYPGSPLLPTAQPVPTSCWTILGQPAIGSAKDWPPLGTTSSSRTAWISTTGDVALARYFCPIQPCAKRGLQPRRRPRARVRRRPVPRSESKCWQPGVAKRRMISSLVTPLGYPTEVVAEGEWFKVRVGPFTDRAAAQAAVESIKRQIGGNPFLVHEP